MTRSTRRTQRVPPAQNTDPSPSPTLKRQHPSSGTTVPDPDIEMGGQTYSPTTHPSAFTERLASSGRRDSQQTTTSSPQTRPQHPQSGPQQAATTPTPLVNGTSPLMNGNHATSNGLHSSASSDTVTGSFEDVAEYMKELMATMHKLEQLGVEKSQIPLPRIVVAGDQSAGKSSFIEAISQISVPRNAGTCTRCPIQITTSSSDEEWACDVKLISKYTYYDHKYLASQGDCYIPGPYHPWQESAVTTTFEFAHLTDKSTVCETIERAQLAILHPSQHPVAFRHGPIPASKDAEVKFSPNYISLEISGPGLPNLSFYDLPGVISRTRNPDERYLVDLVENLVKEYISDENSIVALAIPLEQDQEQSRTSRLIDEVGANDRCVGVLTKPDRFAIGSPVDGLVEILSGKALPLGHGYFVTKQPDQTQRALTHNDARGLEELFFGRTAPWSIELRGYQKQFGTKNIQDALSKLLFDQITALLPEIRTKLADKLTLINEELSTLPEVPAQDVIHIVSGCINAFTDEVSAFIRGRYPNNAFQNLWKEDRRNLVKSMAALRPRLTLNMSLDNVNIAQIIKGSPSKSGTMAVMDLTGDDDDDSGTPHPVPAFSTPRKRKAESEDPFTTPNGTPSKRHNRGGAAGHITFSIEYIRSFLDSYSAVGLQGAYDPEAVVELILKCLNWEPPARELLASAQRGLSESLQAVMAKHLRGYEKTELYTTIRTAVQDFLRAKFHEYEACARRCLRHEQHPPSSAYSQALDAAKATALSELKEARFKVRAKRYLEAQAKGGKAADVESTLDKPKEKQMLETLLGADPAEREVAVMAQIRGYYQVASMRFTDCVYRAMEVEVFEELKTGLKGHLERQVVYVPDVDVQDRCAQLLAEDPASERRRAELRQEKANLEEASQMLNELARKHGADLEGIDWSAPIC